MSQTEWARVSQDGVVIETRWLDEDPPQTLAPHKGRWVKVDVVAPPHDPDAEVQEGPVEAVSGDKLVRTYPVRTKTPTELADEADRKLAEQYPPNKRIDMLGRVVELLVARHDKAWTTAEADEAAALLADWKKLKPARGGR